MFLFYRSQIRPWLSYSIVQFGKILCSDSTHPPPFLLTPQEFAVLEGNEAYVTVCECLKTVRGNFVKSLKGGKAEGGRKERTISNPGGRCRSHYICKVLHSRHMLDSLLQ